MPTESMEFKSHLCVALIVMLCCACCHVSSQHTENTNSNQPVDDSMKMTDMLWRQLRDTASILTDAKTLIMLQTQHNRDVTKDVSDLQIQFSSAMAGMTEALKSVNSQVRSLEQQQQEQQRTITSQIRSLEQQQQEQQRTVTEGFTRRITEAVTTISSQIRCLGQQQHEKEKTVIGGCAGNITGLATICVHSHLISVPCDGQGWIVIQRRLNSAYYFQNRDWQDYKRGFGNLASSFWLGLEDIHRLTNRNQAKLRVELEDWEGETRYAQYSNVRVEGENQKYRMFVDGYSGTAGDGLSSANGMMFTTPDSDNDEHPTSNCADIRSGGWWYNGCGRSSLNGVYVSGGACKHLKGIIWYYWKGWSYSYKKTEIKLFIH